MKHKRAGFYYWSFLEQRGDKLIMERSRTSGYIPWVVVLFVLGGHSPTCGVPIHQDTEYVIADTLYGKIRGEHQVISSSLSLDVFLGVPYAKPPVGYLRFARPQFPAPWSHTRDALGFGAQCPQKRLLFSPQADLPFSEDCLYLNIYAPRINDKSAPLPVMFWIHGGGYISGTGALYNGTELALRGVVVVTINYRLDVLGFLSTADAAIPGNFGMLDQVLALEWVRDNIIAFGGNPRDITIFGQSAGASSVSLHLLSPLSRGKFHKAIMESGVALCHWAVNPSNTTYFAPRPIAQLLGLGVGCSHQQSDKLLSCLRGIELSYIVNVSIGLHKSLNGALLWLPVVETTFGFLPDKPANLYKNGAVADVPTIRGYTKNEVAVAINDPDNKGFSVKKFVKILTDTSYFLFQKNNVLTLAEIEATYLRNQTDPFGRRSDFERLLSDFFMVAPITYEAQLHSKLQKKSRSYLYQFSYRASFNPLPSWKGVVHADDLPLVFGLPQGPAQLAFNFTDTMDIKVANTMVTLWTNFAKTGNPTPQGSHQYQNILSSHDRGGKDYDSKMQAALKIVKQTDKSILQAKSSIDGFDWPALSSGTSKYLLDINAQPNWGEYVRTKAVELWMKKIPFLQR